MSIDSQFTTSTIPTQSTPEVNRYGFRPKPLYTMHQRVIYTNERGLSGEGIISAISWVHGAPACRYQIQGKTRTEVVKEENVHPVITTPASEWEPIHAEFTVARDAMHAALLAWTDALYSDPFSEKTSRLSQAHDAAYERYMKALKANAAWGSKKKEEAVTPAAPPPAPVSAEAETSRTGRVSCYDAKNDYGYIVSKGQSFYFQKRHLKHSGMSIKGGDVVTFSVWESRTGMPKATGIVVEGYVAPKNAAVERAQEEARKTAEREARRKAIRQADIANRQSALKVQGA